MNILTQRFFILLLIFVVGGLGWWLGSATQPTPEQPKIVVTPKKVAQPKLPAPAVTPLPAAVPSQLQLPEKIDGPFARLMKDPQVMLKLTAAQLSNYLAENHRYADSLLAAFRLTGDIAFLREAAQKFPENAAVQMELAFRSGDDRERRGAIDSLRRNDPSNALGDYLSALDHLCQGHSEDAFNDLIAAAGKTQFDDYSVHFMQNAEEAYLSAGFTPVEAKAAAMYGLQRQQIQPMRDLAKQLGNLQKSYASSGDAASAESIRQMGNSLGRLMQGTAGYYIDELAGISIEKQFLDPATGDARQQELKQRTDIIRTEVGGQGYEQLMLNITTQEAISYFDRLKLHGESAAIQWLRQRHGL